MFKELNNDQLYILEHKVTRAYVRVRDIYGPWSQTSTLLFDVMMELHYEAMNRIYYHEDMVASNDS